MKNVSAQILKMIEAGALFAINDSGGKDSQAMRIVLRRFVPKAQIVVVHASLGSVEWPGALEHAEQHAARDGFKFILALAKKSFLEMVERRFATRPDVPSWPSSATRQCTSDLKRGPIERELRRELESRGLKLLVNCMGIRAAESRNRAKLATLRRNDRNSVAGRDWWDWLPIHDMSTAEVFGTITAAAETPHGAYAMGNDRLSCMFCIMGSKNDLRNAAHRNPTLYRRYVELERRTGYTITRRR